MSSCGRGVFSLLSVLAALAACGADPVATGCPDFEVELPRPCSTTWVAAADHGFSVTNDLNAAAIRRALAAARRTGAAGVVLAPGVYRCFDDEGVSLHGFSDFTLDGKGARLVFRRPARKPGERRPAVDVNFLVTDCTRLVLRDFACDWDWEAMPLGQYARPVAVHVDAKTDNASYVDYELTDYSASNPHPACGKPIPLLVCNAMTADGRSFRANGGGWCNGHAEGYYGAKNAWLGPNLIRVWPGVKDASQPYRACYDHYFSSQSNRGAVRSMQTNTLYRLVNYYYGKGCFLFGRNAHVTVRRCAVESCFGAGVTVNGPMHHWQFVDFDFGQGERPARLRPVTTTCDAQHVANSLGWCKYVRCRWNRNLDDTNNFHDGALLAEWAGPRELRPANPVTRDQSGVRVGTPVELFEENYDATGVRGKVVAVSNGVYRLDRAVPKPRFSLFVARNRDFASDNIIFRDCDFTDGCMRNLIQCSQVTVENCTFRRESGSPLRLMVEWTRQWWTEGTRATNIVVRNCLFEANQIDDWRVDGVTSEIFCGARLAASGGGHDGTKFPPPSDEAVQRVLVEGCRFVNPRGAVLHVGSGRNIVWRNNTVRIDDPRPDDPPYRGKKVGCPKTP